MIDNDTHIDTLIGELNPPRKVAEALQSGKNITDLHTRLISYLTELDDTLTAVRTLWPDSMTQPLAGRISLGGSTPDSATVGTTIAALTDVDALRSELRTRPDRGASFYALVGHQLRQLYIAVRAVRDTAPCRCNPEVVQGCFDGREVDCAGAMAAESLWDRTPLGAAPAMVASA